MIEEGLLLPMNVLLQGQKLTLLDPEMWFLRGNENKDVTLVITIGNNHQKLMVVEDILLLIDRSQIEVTAGAALTAKIVPIEDEPDDTKDLKTQAELVAHFKLAVDDSQATSVGSFDNTVNHLCVLNPSIELNTSGIGVNYYVADR